MLSGFVKLPATRLLTLTWISNPLFAAIFAPGAGLIMMEEIMLAVEGMSPMTIPLQEPEMTCFPFVKRLP